MSDMNGYVTSNMVSFLDGYYNSSTKVNGGSELTITLNSSTTTTDANGAALNLARSGYRWVSINASDDYISQLDENNATIRGDKYGAFTSNSGYDVNVTLPSSNGAYFLYLQLVDKAGNSIVYKYEKAIVIDGVSAELIDIKNICVYDGLESDSVTHCRLDTNTDSFIYRYSSGSTIKVVASYTRPISSALSVTMTIGSEEVNPTSTILGMSVIYTYEVVDGNNGYVTFDYAGLHTLNQYNFYYNNIDPSIDHKYIINYHSLFSIV